jgi:hypothetical protein
MSSLDGASPSYSSGREPSVYTGVINRGDTASKVLFTLPQSVVILDIAVIGETASNAATTAVISVGFNTGTEFVNAWDVRASQGSNASGGGRGIYHVTNSLFSGSLSSNFSIGSNPLPVTGIYTETGGASTAGGPWGIAITTIDFG